VLLEAGAQLCSFDFSNAVDACRTTVGPRRDHVLAQGDIYEAPFPEQAFDKVFCYGVLQHTPDPEGAFRSLLRHLKPGGEIAVDVYRKAGHVNRWSSKYLYRPLTSRMDPERLRRIVEWYIPRWLPVDDRLRAIPFLGRYLVSVVPCWNYAETIPDEDERRAWAVLDTFDALSARFDKPQTLESVTRWLQAAGLREIVVRPGGNGILAKGRTAD
jgi:SAM-dependent methyltransferase